MITFEIKILLVKFYFLNMFMNLNYPNKNKNHHNSKEFKDNKYENIYVCYNIVFIRTGEVLELFKSKLPVSVTTTI